MYIDSDLQGSPIEENETILDTDDWRPKSHENETP